MMRLVNRLLAQAGVVKGLRARAARRVHRLRGFRGNVDGYRDGALVGWVMPWDRAGGPVKVGVFSARGLITQGVANIDRPDLAQSGISTGYHAGRYGFSIGLDPIALRTIRSTGGRVRVKTLSDPAFEVGQFDFSQTGEAGGPLTKAEDSGSTTGGQPGDLSQLLFGSIAQLQGLRDQQSAVQTDPPPLTAHRAIFAQDDYIHGGPLPGLMTGYAEYVRYRYKLDESFDSHADAGEIAHFLNWYLAGYSTLRTGLRVPLSRDMIAYFNEDILIPGQRISLSRVTWAFMMNVPPLVQSMSFQNPDWVAWVVYWWAIDQARGMYVEDCLVPQSYIDLLAAVPDPGPDHDPELGFAPSLFMIRFHAQTPALAALDLDKVADRRQLVLVLLLMAVQRPDYLRYIPQHAVEALLAPGPNGTTPLALFLREMTQDPTLALTRADYAAVLRHKGFDLETCRFLTFTAQGDRIEVAMLPPVATVSADRADKVDVQVIGPFEKASGLGQATRLSAQVLAQISGLRVNCVDYGLDNPAPEGFSRVGALGNYQPAKINLLHMNAESVPLAFAYQPDVFSGAYNIGYFFWELDTPAACHYLALHMLDEIWVSTAYGVQIYQPEFNGPVSNVGMCFEDLPAIERADARHFVQGLFGFEASHFIFLVAFDSFSFIQRKNPVGTLRAFQAAFAGVADVRLVIKTQNRRKVSDPVQIVIWEQVDKLIKADKRIVVLDETLSYGDLLRLKKGSDAYVSLHKSEGWGFGMIEAMNLGVPVICTGYSGNMDFCSEDTAFLVDYTLTALGPDDYIFVRPGQKWAEPDVADAARQMRLVYDNAALRRTKAAVALANVRQNFGTTAIAARYQARLQEILKSR
jgi:glycosyltransferase involved in cell wall biosynthesis